jgi:dTDP-4-dehydrorhamnose reductase
MLTLVTGASGQLGRSIKSLVKLQNISNSFVFTTRDQLDLSYLNNIQSYFKDHKFDLIINCAAYTKVDKAELDEKQANLINHLAVKQIAEIAQNKNIKLIHISTDFVFDGFKSQPYLESDATDPLNIYGKTKLAGENAVISIMKFNAIIIRTSWVYSEYGNNFVDTILKLVKNGNELNVVSDQIGTPTYASDLGLAILNIIRSEKFNRNKQESQIYHYSNKGFCNWYIFAKEIIKILGSNCILNSIKTEDYLTTAKRPRSTVMSTDKISLEFDLKINFWKDSLKVCMKRLPVISVSNKN